MPRKKSVEKTSSPVKNKQVKVPKTRIKKEKPKLKIASIVKVKIPTVKSLQNHGEAKMTTKPLTAAQRKTFSARDRKVELSNEGAENHEEAKMTTKPQTAAQRRAYTAKERKVELANEVAHSQLVKSPTKFIVNIPNVTELPKAKKVKVARKRCTKALATSQAIPQKRGRPKNIPQVVDAENFQQRGRPKNIPQVVEHAENSNTQEIAETPKKRVVRKPKKSLIKIDIENTDVPSQRKVESTTNKKPTPLRRIKSTPVPTTPTNFKTSPKQTRSYKRKGKTVPEDTPTNDHILSPSTLDFKIPNNCNAENTPDSLKEIVTENSDLVNCRKTSTNSECPSWTKDISSSSTTTCVTVCSTDFVCIDNKIPMIKLSNIDKELKNTKTIINEDDHSLSDSDTKENSTKCTSESSWSSSDSSASGPNLSSPSVKSHNTPINNATSPSSTTKNNISKMEYVLDKLSAKLKQLDLEIIKWIGYGNEDLPKPNIEFHNKILTILREESDVIKDCRSLKAIFSTEKENFEISDKNVTNIDSNVNSFTQPNSNYDVANIPDISEDDNCFTTSASKDAMLDQGSDHNSILDEKDCTDASEDDFSSSKVKYTNYDENYDDDDALSLYAESITGLESSRYSSAVSMCVGTDFEEYIPVPVSKAPVAGVRYNPTKISSEANEDGGVTNKTKTICKKQFADSTYRESELTDAPLDVMNASNVSNDRSYESVASDQTAVGTPLIHPLTVKNPTASLMSSLHKPTQAVRSGVFRGVCFFNLISNCKKTRCVFPHVQMDLNEVKSRLARLTNSSFIGEYMLMRSWPGLRRLYGMCFVEECLHRELTTILVEMAIDFIQKANVNSVEDAILKVHVNELVLMHLNKVDLNECADLLRYNVEQNMTLSDVFMKTIAETQNFYRFKLVFINLTNFIVQNGGSFGLGVANQILERVCILPSEEPLARAVMTIIQKTDQSIFGNTMTRNFEKHLSSLDGDLYEKFLSLKEQAFEKLPGLDNVNREQEKISLAQSEGDRYTSPDTTKLDNLNKSMEEPVVTRNLDMIRNLSFNKIHQNLPHNLQEDYRPPAKKPKFQYSTTPFKQFLDRFRFPMRPMRPIMRPPMDNRRLNQRYVPYGQFTNYPRPPGPPPGF